MASIIGNSQTVHQGTRGSGGRRGGQRQDAGGIAGQPGFDGEMGILGDDGDIVDQRVARRLSGKRRRDRDRDAQGARQARYTCTSAS